MANETVTQCAANLMDSFHVMMHAVHSDKRRQMPKELSLQQFRAMRIIMENEGTSLSNVADHLGNTLSATSKLIDGLVDRGYVLRGTARDDRRKLILEVTDSGASKLDSIHMEVISTLSEKLESLTPNECAMIDLAMEIMRRALISGRGAKTTDTEK